MNETTAIALTSALAFAFDESSLPLVARASEEWTRAEGDVWAVSVNHQIDPTEEVAVAFMDQFGGYDASGYRSFTHEELTNRLFDALFEWADGRKAAGDPYPARWRPAFERGMDLAKRNPAVAA